MKGCQNFESPDTAVLGRQTLKGYSAFRGHGLFGEGNCYGTKIILVHASCSVSAKFGQTK